MSTLRVGINRRDWIAMMIDPVFLLLKQIRFIHEDYPGLFHFFAVTMRQSVDTMLPKLQAVFEKQPIVKAWLFGSYSRGEETPESDVDILVEYDHDSWISLMTISRIMVALSAAIGKKVDLVEVGHLLPSAQESAEKDKILIYERAC